MSSLLLHDLWQPAPNLNSHTSYISSELAMQLLVYSQGESVSAPCITLNWGLMSAL